jgi:hypothetical protein
MWDSYSCMNTTLIKPIECITGRNTTSGLTQTKKLKLVSKHLNPSKYEIVGFVDRTNDVVLRPRYYNVRNSLGQFAAVI